MSLLFCGVTICLIKKTEMSPLPPPFSCKQRKVPKPNLRYTSLFRQEVICSTANSGERTLHPFTHIPAAPCAHLCSDPILLCWDSSSACALNAFEEQDFPVRNTGKGNLAQVVDTSKSRGFGNLLFMTAFYPTGHRIHYNPPHSLLNSDSLSMMVFTCGYLNLLSSMFSVDVDVFNYCRVIYHRKICHLW